jgi:hypothetical protein
MSSSYVLGFDQQNIEELLPLEVEKRLRESPHRKIDDVLRQPASL